MLNKKISLFEAKSTERHETLGKQHDFIMK